MLLRAEALSAALQGESELRAGLLKTKFPSVYVCLYAYLKSIATKPLQ